MLDAVIDVSPELLKQAGVSRKDHDQIKMLMKLDREIFMSTGKMHPTNHILANDFDHFVDFSRLPDKINKNAKMLLYRPTTMAKLKKSFDAIVTASQNEEFRRA